MAELVAEVTKDVITDVTVVGVVAAVAGGAPPGGSRWNMTPRDVGLGCVPTANPLVLDNRNILFSLPLLGNGGIVVTVFQAVPSQCRRTGRPLIVSWPAAQPSVVEST